MFYFLVNFKLVMYKYYMHTIYVYIQMLLSSIHRKIVREKFFTWTDNEIQRDVSSINPVLAC